MRPGVEVREVRPEDQDQLVGLCLEARAESTIGSQICSADPATLSTQLGTLAAAPGGVVLVAVEDSSVIGMLLGRCLGPSLFADEMALAVEAVYVSPGHRRRGAGHSLMLAAADLAERVGATTVYSAPIPGARGMHRFFVQLGFTPAAAHRVTTTAALQRRLSQDVTPRRRSSLEELIARRRRSRAGDAGQVESGAVAEVQGMATGVGGADRVDAVEKMDPGQAGRRSVISRHVRRAVQIRREAESSTTIS